MVPNGNIDICQTFNLANFFPHQGFSLTLVILRPRIRLVEELPEIINKENVQRISNMICALLNRND